MLPSELFGKFWNTFEKLNFFPIHEISDGSGAVGSKSTFIKHDQHFNNTAD